MAKAPYSIKQRVAGAIASALILTLIAAVSVWVKQPLLAPSLGSALFVQTLTPTQQSAQPWSTAVGQIAGAIGGFAAVYLVAAAHAPTFMDHHPLLPNRVVATLIAIVLTGALQLTFKAVSAAGAATALVVVVGAETADWAGAGRLLVAILVATALGEVARRGILKLK